MRERTQFPDPEIDREEEAWWNEQAGVVEAIWAMEFAEAGATSIRSMPSFTSRWWYPG